MGVFWTLLMLSALAVGEEDMVPQIRQAFPVCQDLDVTPNVWMNEVPSGRRRNALGAFAVGNGRVFSLLGLGDPLNSLHSMIGPTYQKKTAYFSDISLGLEKDGQPLLFEHERAFRIRGTGVVITQGNAGMLRLWTQDFAPWGDVPVWAKTCILRLVCVENLGEIPVSGLCLVLEQARPSETLCPGQLAERVDDRWRTAVFQGTPAEPQGRCLKATLPVLPAGGAFRAHCGFALGEGETPQALPEIDQDLSGRLLKSTLDQWRIARPVVLTCADPRVPDLMDSLLTCIRIQQTESGATTPMSLYTSTWLRDTVGAVDALLSMGLFEEARSMLLYQLRAIKKSGAIRNARPCDETTTEQDLKGEWRLQSFMSGRVGAEAPSYLPLMVRRYVETTGDLSFLKESFPILIDCVKAQKLENGLLPFSGDETFRVAMASNMGLDLEYPFETETWSANSAFLYVAAAEAVGELAKTVGQETAVQEILLKAREARDKTEQTFWMEEGFYAPFIFKTDHVPMKVPYVDVNAVPLWMGYLRPCDEKAVANVQAWVDRLQTRPGTFHGRMNERYLWLGAWLHAGAVHTGMTFGFALDNLSKIHHPLAEQAFEALLSNALSSGTFSEYMIQPGPASLTLAYDRTGSLGDYTGQFRPWEGGINLEAMLTYLVGFSPEAAEGKVSFSPHVPKTWDQFELRDLRMGDRLLAVRAEASESSQTFKVKLCSGTDVRVSVTLTGFWKGPCVAVARGDPEVAVEIQERFGLTSGRFQEVSLKEGEEVSWTFQKAGSETGT